jgi:hypothetical protein
VAAKTQYFHRFVERQQSGLEDLNPQTREALLLLGEWLTLLKKDLEQTYPGQSRALIAQGYAEPVATVLGSMLGLSWKGRLALGKGVKDEGGESAYNSRALLYRAAQKLEEGNPKASRSRYRQFVAEVKVPRKRIIAHVRLPSPSPTSLRRTLREMDTVDPKPRWVIFHDRPKRLKELVADYEGRVEVLPITELLSDLLTPLLKLQLQLE